jgi:hypothetical protein
MSATGVGNEAVPKVLYNYNDFKAGLFAYYDGIGRDNWDETFIQIDPDLLSLYNPGTGFTGTHKFTPGRGYGPFDPDENPGIGVAGGQRAFYPTSTLDINNKITREPSYDADAVAFVPDQDCDIFLVPQIQLWEGRNRYIKLPGGTALFDLRIQMLGLFLAPESRNFVLYNPDWLAWRQEFFDFQASPGVGNRWMLPHTWSTTYHAMWMNLFRNHPASQMKFFDYGEHLSFYPLALTEGELSGGSPGDFKDGTQQLVTADFRTAASTADRTWLNGPWVGIRTWHRPEGLLEMIIRKRPSNPQWYYVWRQAASDVGLFLDNQRGRLHETQAGTAQGSAYGGVRWIYTL